MTKTKALSAFCAALMLGCTVTSPAMAQEETEQSQSALEMRSAQVVGVVNGEIAPEDVFTDGFLASVPPEQLAAISQSLTSQFGKAVSVESLGAPNGTRSALAIRMERAIARGGIAIDPADDNRISELLFQTFDPIDDSVEKIEADLAALPGDVAYWFGPLEGGPPIMASDWGDHMPIGSTFKLYVLATLAAEVETGNLEWGDIVTLGDTRSFPSGMMQDWPKGSQVILETLASLMISVSDNTATDALINELGRINVFAMQGESNHSNPRQNDPFLTTREMFLLKGGPAKRLAAYQAGDANTRDEILETLEDIEVPRADISAAFSAGPIALDIEWFASASDLVNLLRHMRETADPRAFEIMAINPNVPVSFAENWSYAGYKGGSEPGVLNLTWLLTDKDGVDHALVLSWRNDEANLDQTALELIGQRILSLPQ